MSTEIATGPNWELRLGDWREVMADVECDVLLTDPPYSDRVHAGQRTGSSTRKTTLHYSSIDEAYCSAFVESWAPRTRHWAVTFSDHLAATWWERAWLAAGWYVFAPVIWLRTCPTPRLAGDGPTSAADYLTVASAEPPDDDEVLYLSVARPRRRLQQARIGSRPGFYAHKGNDGRENPHPGSKGLDPMRRLVRDYSLPGDVIADPHAGSGTTLAAAGMEGRFGVGCEAVDATFEIARKRLEALKYTAISRSLFEATSGEQMALGGEK